MSATTERRISQVLTANEGEILTEWLKRQKEEGRTRYDEAEARAQSTQFLKLFAAALEHGNIESPGGQHWQDIFDMLSDLSRTRARLGFSPSETAVFIFSLKQPLFDRLRRDFGNDAQGLGDAIWSSTNLLDKLGLYTTEVYQKGREEVILRQQQDMLELSTPVVSLWSGILALPMIGTLDSARTQVVMETLLQRIVDTGADVAILDITGVPTVDTLTAQHLIKTVTAARLMGAECIISGIRPQIAQTIVHLGVELGDIITKATLADAFRVALQRRRLAVVKTATQA